MYERHNATGAIRRSDGIEKPDYTQIEFHRVIWRKKESKSKQALIGCSKYVMQLPYTLFGMPMAGAGYKFMLPYKVKAVSNG